MVRGIPISSAGAKFGYAVETVAGTMPKTALLIPDIKSGPDLNPIFRVPKQKHSPPV